VIVFDVPLYLIALSSNISSVARAPENLDHLPESATADGALA
jgi:hypothetical protein